MLNTFAVFARAVTLLMTIVGSWLLTSASWNGWWSINTRTQLSGVRSASRPTFVNVCMMHSFLLFSVSFSRSPLNGVHKRVEGGDPTIIRCDQHIDASNLPRLAGRTKAPRQASDTTVCISIRQL